MHAASHSTVTAHRHSTCTAQHATNTDTKKSPPRHTSRAERDDAERSVKIIFPRIKPNYEYPPVAMKTSKSLSCAGA